MGFIKKIATALIISTVTCISFFAYLQAQSKLQVPQQVQEIYLQLQKDSRMQMVCVVLAVLGLLAALLSGAIVVYRRKQNNSLEATEEREKEPERKEAEKRIKKNMRRRN